MVVFQQVFLVANYALDDQPSMLRYAEALADGLVGRGYTVVRLAPQGFFAGTASPGKRPNKWLGYFDKYLVFPFVLRYRLAEARRRAHPAIVHICDHSNAMYAFDCGKTPVVVTCHDIGAIKGARGLLPDCPATFLGRLLQQWICAGLRRASRIACVSQFTAGELRDLVLAGNEKTIRVVPNGFNRSFQQFAEDAALPPLNKWPVLAQGARYILAVGSGLRRKNRAVILRVFATVWRELDAWLVIAGEPLDTELRRLASEMEIAQRLIEVVRPDDADLEALYRQAYALLFPSRFEGFGWPIIEAQACGCPVLAANNSAQPEVIGQWGLIRDSEDVDGYAADLLKLKDPAIRQELIKAGRQNAQRFSMEKVLDSIETIYRELHSPLLPTTNHEPRTTQDPACPNH